MYTVLIPGRKKKRGRYNQNHRYNMDKKRAEMVELPPTAMNFLFYAAPAMAYVSLL